MDIVKLFGKRSRHSSTKKYTSKIKKALTSLEQTMACEMHIGSCEPLDVALFFKNISALEQSMLLRYTIYSIINVINNFSKSLWENDEALFCKYIKINQQIPKITLKHHERISKHKTKIV